MEASFSSFIGSIGSTAAWLSTKTLPLTYQNLLFVESLIIINWHIRVFVHMNLQKRGAWLFKVDPRWRL